LNQQHDAHLPPNECKDAHSVITGLWSNYGTVRHWISTNISNSIARQTDADDVMQETFAEACRNADDLAKKDDKAALNWLSLVARRKLIDRFRRAGAKRRKAVESRSVTPDGVDIPAMISTPSSFVARREAKELLIRALSQLSDRHRLAIRLRFFEDRPYSEVSEQLEISVEAAQMLTKRALRKLKETLGNRSRLLK